MPSITITSAREKFVEFLAGQKRASATILAYGNDITQLASFLKEKGISQAAAVNQALLDQFKANLNKDGYTAKSISRKINSIKTFFRFLKSQKIIENDPAASVSHPKYDIKPPRILSKIEYRALRDACRDDVRISAIVELMLQTGVRIGELANLRLEDYQDSGLYVRPYESHEARTIPLNRPAKNALETYLTHRPQKIKEKVIFVTKTGRPFLVRNIRSAIERYFTQAGIKNAKVNDLRHTWIYYQLEAGVSVATIAKLAGHKRVSTTEKYLELIGNKKDQTTKLEEL
jgi:site-specific recombinase XerD